MEKNLHYTVQAALIAALYVTLTYAQNFIVPGSTSMAVQFRVSEALNLLAVFTPAAIPGLTVGCLLSNIVNIGVLPFDVIIGTAATLFSAILIYMLRKVMLFKLPIIAACIPALLNGIMIGLEIEVFLIEGPFNLVSFLIQGGLVALGELTVCLVLGLPFYVAIKNSKLFKKI